MLKSQLAVISEYVLMRDGVRLAASTWLTREENHKKEQYPAVLISTRYWRGIAYQPGDESQQVYYSFALACLKKGYRLVVVDARGSGASYGSRMAEVDYAEAEDIGELVDWVTQQPWSDGRVVKVGVSYTAITALYGMLTASSALKVSVCRAPDFDMYRHLFAPGGIVNRWFVKYWGAYTKALDTNDVEAMFNCGYMAPPDEGYTHILGVQPVDIDSDSSLLDRAINEHQQNFNIGNHVDYLDFIEDFISEKNPPVFDSRFRKRITTNKVPVVIRCGWHDAGTQLGALAMFETFSHPTHIVIGPWNHDGSFLVDPFETLTNEQSSASLLESARSEVFKSFEAYLSLDGCRDTAPRLVEYYTLGENLWKKTVQWPLPQTHMKQLYLSEKNLLSGLKPEDDQGFDHYRVDPDTTTGVVNRWHAQASNQPVYFPDRRQEDNKLMVYDSAPLESDIEITGHPVVELFISSTRTDGQFFAYLEMIDLVGSVRLLTEGQLRGIHRKVSTKTPPYKMFGPYHSLKKIDAMPLVPEEIALITFDLLPISVLLPKGYRIRLAIAGADSDTFAHIKGLEKSEWEIQRNRAHPSSIHLPIIARTKD